MITKKEISEIKELLEKSQNPLFFFDNDVDGLCSFLILYRYLGRGIGIPIRSFPDLGGQYLRKLDEFNSDAVFILDKPKVSEEFISGVLDKNIPLTWIDHHEVQINPDVLKKINYYNSFPTAEPVTYLCYKISGKDEWLAMIGCVGDVYKPDFAEEFAEEYPELFNSKISAFDSLFSTKIGEVVKMLNFGLKDTTTNVVKIIRYLQKASGVYDILEENKFTKRLHERASELKKIHDSLFKKAQEGVSSSKLVFFTYSGETSMSSELANSLYFANKNKFVVVAYKKPDKINLSIRGKNAKKITTKLIEKIDGATGGGHEEACGAQIPADKLEDFKKDVENQL